MTRITEEQQRSRIRAGTVQSAVANALVAAVEQNPDLTYEEIIDALLSIALRNVEHLRRAQATTVGDRL